MDSQNLIRHLCHKLFVANPDGKKLIQLLKEWHMKTPVFPCDAEKLKRHGGAKGWAGFRAGQLDSLLRVEHIATEYEMEVVAQSTKKENK